MLKKIIFTFISFFLAYRSYFLVHAIIATEANGFNNPLIWLLSFLLTLYITGIFAFLGFAYNTNRILPHRYYHVHHPKKLNQIAKIIGVKYFRVMLLMAFWGRKKNKIKFFDGTKSGLVNFIHQTKQSEFGHLAAFIAILGYSVFLLWHKSYSFVLIITIINIIGNLYPIILQRQHRIRIQKVLNT